MIRYREGATSVTAVECEKVGYPHKDADGETQYDNTHFDTESEAWAAVMSGREAHVSAAGSAVKSAERQLALANEGAVEAARLFSDARYARDTWLRTTEEKA